MNGMLTWQEYEEKVFKHFCEKYLDAQVTKNVLVPGRYSIVDRQVDVLVDGVIPSRNRLALPSKDGQGLSASHINH